MDGGLSSLEAVRSSGFQALTTTWSSSRRRRLVAYQKRNAESRGLAGCAKPKGDAQPNVQGISVQMVRVESRNANVG
jgi:hypothetical protein